MNNTENAAVAEALFSVFDRIYVINLRERADRRREVDIQLRRIGLSLDHPRVTLFPATRFDEAGPFPSLGARGCFDSHLSVLQRHLDSGDDRAIVLEDDVDFIADIVQQLPRVISALKQESDWQMLYSVRPMQPAPGDDLAAGGVLCRVAPEQPVVMLHFLGISREFAECAVPMLEAIRAREPGDPAGGPMHVDGALNWVRKAHPDVKVVATLQPLAIQRSSRSDIADLKFYDRIPVLRELVGLLRGLRRRQG